MDSQNPDEQPSKMLCFDRLSDLPDELVEKILSFLPTKNALGASILSKRWKNLNPFGVLPIRLDLNDDDWKHRHVRSLDSFFDKLFSRSYDRFFDKLFNQTLRDVTCIDNLTLTLRCEGKLIERVSAALRLDVKTLSLALHNTSSDDTQTLFEMLDGNTSLVCLELFCHKSPLLIRGYDGSFNSLPSLKRLHLNNFTCSDSVNFITIGRLIDCCPVLDELEIVGCSFHYDSCLNIQSRKLKSLTIEDTSAEIDIYHRRYKRSSLNVVLNIPNLQLFTFKSGVPSKSNFVFTFKSLTSAHLDFHPYQCYDDLIWNNNLGDSNNIGVSNNIGKIIAACCSTKRLYISFESFTDLQFTSLQLPVFQNLTQLSLGYLENDGWTVLASLLKSAPMLENLTFEKGLPKTGFESFKRLLASPPSCLELHIKCIEFRLFQWEKYEEVYVLNYFKQCGKVLERLVVNSVVEPIANHRMYQLRISQG